MTNIESRALIISPHQDDAILSVGAFAHENYGDIRVLNLFTRSSAHMIEGVSNDPEVVSAIRRGEDEAVAGLYGFTFKDAGFSDAEERGIAWNDVSAPVDVSLRSELEETIASFIYAEGSSDSTVYLPAAFGLHPDHYLTLQAGLRASINHPLRIYADQPYYFSPHGARHGALDMLTKRDAISYPFDVALKTDMLRLYPSQLTPERIKFLSDAEREYYWEVAMIARQALITAAESRRNLHTVRFGDSRWLHVTKASYGTATRQFVDVEVQNYDSELIKTPLMIESHHIEGLGDVRFARHAGVNTVDYMDYEGMRSYDAGSLAQLKDQARVSGAQYIWFSGMRERDGYLLLLEHATTGLSETFEGISSYITTCHPNGFNAWLASKDSIQRKKFRQIFRKLDMLTEENDVIFELKSGTTAMLQDFLALQRERAIVTGMDAFIENMEYRDFLEKAVAKGLVSFANLVINNKTVATLAILDDEKNQSLAILAQGFDNEWAYYSPSYIAMYKLIELAHNHQYRSVDFLRGDERYKAYFTDTREVLYKHLEALAEVSSGEWSSVCEYVKGYEE